MQPSCARALVLGSRPVAERIARDFEEEGYEPEFREELPSPADPNAPDRLREILADFAERSGRPPASKAHCLHPGISAWADRPELALIGQEYGLSVLAPPARVLSLFGNKLAFLLEAEQAGVPTAMLESDPVHSVGEIERLLDRHHGRLPLVLKSVRGGGGHGTIVVQQPEDLERRIPLWLEQLRMNVGEALLFAERYVEGARHLTLPFARFHDGRFEAFPLLDSSLQLRHRKLIEFCPAGLEPVLERQLREWARRLADRTGYIGVGAFEFLVDADRAWLVEGVCRLGAGFELWERVAGTNVVSWQLAAIENRVPEPRQFPPREWREAVGVRLHAEDPILQLPQPGVIHELSEQRAWKFPGAEALLRLDVEEGEDLRGRSTGFLGLLLAGGQDRHQAVTLLRGALEEIWIAGSLQTNERFLAELLLHPWVREGVFHAGFVDEEFVPELRPPGEWMTLMASICASIDVGKSRSERARWAVADQWVKPQVAALQWAEPPRARGLADPSGEELFGISGRVHLEDGRTIRAAAYPVARDRWLVRLGAWILQARVVDPAAGSGASAGGEARRERVHRLMSLVPGRVHSIHYRVDSRVPAHVPLVILECQGVLVPHALPVEVRVREWKVAAEQSVHLGRELATFALGEPSDGS